MYRIFELEDNSRLSRPAVYPVDLESVQYGGWRFPDRVFMEECLVDIREMGDEKQDYVILPIVPKSK